MPARSTIPVYALAHRLLAVILVPLVFLAALSGPGGWFCADGVQCRPAAALACCCSGTESVAAATRCTEHHGDAHRAALSAESCGCYYHAHTADPLLKAAHVVDGPVALPPVAVLSFVAPPASIATPLPPAATFLPPRYLISPRHTRAPPVT